MQGALFTTPLPLSLLASSDRECSICLEPYIEPSQRGTAQHERQGEWAVRVELVAEVAGLRRCCGHVMGKRCLETHLRSSGPWKRHCPFCRDVWFRESNSMTGQIQGSLGTRTQLRSRTSSRPRISMLGSTPHGRSRSLRNDQNQRHDLRPNASQERRSFTQQVREKLEVKEGSDEVGRSLEEVEKVLIDFYGQ